uniref:Uncharacterized protein n=1 Tax=Oryza punctata TaxID=4537 RepID=A0A0E0LT02_ORYPU
MDGATGDALLAIPVPDELFENPHSDFEGHDLVSLLSFICSHLGLSCCVLCILFFKPCQKCIMHSIKTFLLSTVC